MRRPLLAVLGALLLLALPDTGAAQQADTTANDRVRARLRALRPVAAPDTLVAPDTTRQPPQQVEVRRVGAAAPSPQAEGIPRDSVMEMLARLSGYVTTEYRGEEAAFQADSGRLDLLRDAAVVREGQRLAADSSVTYNEVTGIACGYGRPTISGTGLDAPLTSDTVCYNIASQLGVAINAETSFTQGATWRLLGAQLYTVSDTVYSHDAIFTDCELPWEHVHYHFGAKEVKVVRENTLVARNVTLNFSDVPVFWLPFMVQSLSRGRRSGLLMPRFGINDIVANSSRYNRRVEDLGFFWAISDYMGAEVAFDWHSDNYSAVRGSMDFRVLSQFLEGGLTFRRFWLDEGGTEFTLASRTSWRPDERTTLNATTNYTTSSRFVRQRSLDPRELARSIDSNINTQRQFDWGTLSLGATRAQQLNDGTTTLRLPQLSLNLANITLFPALPGEEHLLSNISWSSSLTGSIEQFTVAEDSRNLSAQPRRNATASVQSGFTIGKFSWSQNFNIADEQRDLREVRPDDRDTTLVYPASEQRRLSWSTALNFQQRLVGTSTFTPGLRVRGELLRNESTGESMIASPSQLDFTARLQTNLYGFWPGVGPLERIRHRLSPSFDYTYSPAPQLDSLQRVVFRSIENVREQNRLSVTVSQTFEGRRRATDTAVVADSAAAAAADTATGPRRLPAGSQPIILLSLSTSAVVYDFVEDRRSGEGFRTEQLTNTVQSDLLRNLQLTFTHELFRREGGTGTTDDPGRRSFAPHLASVAASLSLSSDSWLFRQLRLGSGRRMPEEPGEAGTDEAEPSEGGPAVDRTRPEQGLIGTGRRDRPGNPSGPVGSWSASLNYSLRRPRDSSIVNRESQNLNGNMSFQPTPNWTVRWNTGYNFTLSQFTDHVLTLTRRLHDWDASFDFVKAQNGNFSFQFRVHLRANPDIKLDYEQHDLNALDRF